jgi:hypothetical protein
MTHVESELPGVSRSIDGLDVGQLRRAIQAEYARPVEGFKLSCTI